MYCTKCGAKIDDDATDEFCSNCGAPIKRTFTGNEKKKNCQ